MQTKTCPECGAEYFAHIPECADCGVPLVSPDDVADVRGSPSADAPAGDLVTVREGGREWLEELAADLDAAGIGTRIALAPGCSAGSCGTVYYLLVEKADGEKAASRVEDYLRRMHPELVAADALAAEGRCPACGHGLSDRDRTCPDCGLLLLIEADDAAGE